MMAFERTTFKVRFSESGASIIDAINGVDVDPDMVRIPDPQLAEARMLDAEAVEAFRQLREYSESLSRSPSDPGSRS
jgi:hypothetical protein